MSTTRSGFCQFAMHPRCSGTAAGDPCGCTCHQPAAEPEPDQPLRERVVLLLALTPELKHEDLDKIEALADQVIELVRASPPCP